MNLGETFIPVATARQDHLHIVVSEPNDAGQVAVVNLTTRRWDSDTCCLLQVGDHPWVKHETVVLYSHAQLLAVEALTRGVEASVFRRHRDMLANPLRRIQGGALDCEQTPPLVEAAIRATLGL